MLFMVDDERRAEADKIVTELLKIDPDRLSEKDIEFIWLVSVGPITEEEFSKLKDLEKRYLCP